MHRKSLLFICIGIVGFAFFSLSQVPFDITNVKIQQAAIAAAIVATGWLMTFVFREASELIERNQRGRDLQKALRAEVEDYFEALDDGDSGAAIGDLRSRVSLQGDKADPVFFPLISGPIIFETLAHDIQILPEAVIDDTIRFYSMLTDVRLFAEDMRSPGFSGLSSQGQLTAFEDYIEMRATCCLFAYKAMEKLSRSLGETITNPEVAAQAKYQSDRAEIVENWLNSRDEDHDAHV